MQIDRTRKTFLGIVGLTILFLLAFFGYNIYQRLYPPAGASAEGAAGINLPPIPFAPVEISFNSANTKEDWVNAVTETFNAQQFKTADGRPIVVSVEHGNSGGSQQDILDGKLRPTMWSPGDQSWIDGANQVWRELNGKPLIPEACPPSVYAPIGFAMWRPMAEALGWPDEPISWETIVTLAADPEGWGRYGHPEWGQFKFGHTHPDFSNSGLLIMTALAYDALGQTADLTFEAVKSEPVVEAMRNVERHTYHYGRQSRNLAELMVQRGPAYLQAINTTEAEVLRTNREHADTMQFPLAFIFPAKGTFWTEQPLCILDGDWVSEEQKEAARIYRDYLTAPQQQALAVNYGLRPVDPTIPLHAPIDLENGTDPRVTTDSVPALVSPSADASAAIKDVFHETKKKATIIIALDTSGSMGGAKIREATAATADFVSHLERGDEIAVYPFNSEITELQPAGEASEVKEQLSTTVQTLFANGDTLLYDVICRAVEDISDQRTTDQSAGEQRLYGVVVLSDGEDSGSRLTENDMFNCLPSGEDVDGIKVFTIAFGKDANNEVLQRIATRTNGRMFEGDPETIKTVYEAISAEQ
jgi:Ca-activated chloride channel family protein